MPEVKRILLSKTERKFLEDLLAGKANDRYNYHYRKVLKGRILDKRKQLTADVHLITQAEDLLSNI